MAITGLTSNTPENLLLDAGAFFKNYDLSKTYAQNVSAGALIGATAGGGSFSAVPTVRKIEVDGAKENVAQLQTIDQWVVTMTANVKEITADTIELALGASTKTTPTNPTSYSKILGNADFAEGDYLDNFTWVGRLSGNANPVIIVIKNALALGGLSITMADKNEAVIPVTVTGHYDLDDLDTPPFEIYYPS